MSVTFVVLVKAKGPTVEASAEDRGTMEQLKKRIQPLLNEFDIKVKKLKEVHKPSVRGYNKDKGREVGVDLYNEASGTKRSLDENIRTLLHELAHSMNKRGIGHGQDFQRAWKLLLDHAREEGVYHGDNSSWKSATVINWHEFHKAVMAGTLSRMLQGR